MKQMVFSWEDEIHSKTVAGVVYEFFDKDNKYVGSYNVSAMNFVIPNRLRSLELPAPWLSSIINYDKIETKVMYMNDIIDYEFCFYKDDLVAFIHITTDPEYCSHLVIKHPFMTEHEALDKFYKIRKVLLEHGTDIV